MPDSEAAWDRYLDQAFLSGRKIVTNSPQEVFAIDVGTHRLPVTLNREGRAGTTWVNSLRNAYGPYARVELGLVKMPFLHRCLCGLASLLGEQLIRAGGLSGGAFLGNWLISTNLHPAGLTTEQLLSATKEIAAKEPTLPIIIRSLTPKLHAGLIDDLKSAGFLLFPTRQIWIADNLNGVTWKRLRDVRRDLALEKQSHLSHEWIHGEDFTVSQFGEATQLFNDLYRIKYPRHNPEFTEDFLHLGVDTGALKVLGLRRLGDTALCGMIAMIRRGGVMATTALGYDLNSSLDEGLYRLLSIKAFLIAREAGLPLHCSAGAGGFKNSRGASHHLEYAAVWAGHLPSWRQALLRHLQSLLKKVAIPVLEKPIL